MQAIIPEVDRDLLEKELEGHLLRPSNKADNLIYDITSHECPNVMREIGRLREIAFRNIDVAAGAALARADRCRAVVARHCAKPGHILADFDIAARSVASGADACGPLAARRRHGTAVDGDFPAPCIGGGDAGKSAETGVSGADACRPSAAPRGHFAAVDPDVVA